MDIIEGQGNFFHIDIGGTCIILIRILSYLLESLYHGGLAGSIKTEEKELLVLALVYSLHFEFIFKLLVNLQ